MRRLLALAALVAVLGLALPVTVAEAATLPTGFSEVVTQSGLDSPTAFDFAPDGTLFVAEKRGVVKVFDGVGDTTPSTFADLRTQVHNYADRGLLGIEVDPAWPTRPYVYVHYVYDAPVGGTAPTYGVAGADSDSCSNPSQGVCPATVRVSRLTASEGVMLGETPLLADLCHQFTYHDGGGMQVGPEGALYVSIGEGAWPGTDYGQYGNRCDDPPGGTNLTPPTAEGGQLRSQDLRTPGDPVAVNGAVIRIDPDTGAAWPTNPLVGDADPEARKILAMGLRNPFRLALRPGTDEVFVADVGSGKAEEINRVLPAGPVENFGWPCLEGAHRYLSLTLDVCEGLYADGSASDPFYFYCHAPPVTPGGPCSSAGAAISGITFYEGGTYPAQYIGALFFADYTRNTIWAMLPGLDGVPDPARVETFATDLGGPVDLRPGPGGDLFYVDVFDGTLRRIYVGAPGIPPPDPGVPRPTATIDTPTSATTWEVGEQIGFSGSATDHDGSPLPDSALSWAYNLLHCYSETDCHRHGIETFAGASGTATAPDHEYPAKLELILTATNSLGAKDSTSVVLEARSVLLTFKTSPAGLTVSAGSETGPAPLEVRAIVGASVVISAPTPQQRNGRTHMFRSWSDGGAATHTVTTPSTAATFTARYSK